MDEIRLSIQIDNQYVYIMTFLSHKITVETSASTIVYSYEYETTDFQISKEIVVNHVRFDFMEPKEVRSLYYESRLSPQNYMKLHCSVYNVEELLMFLRDPLDAIQAELRMKFLATYLYSFIDF